MLTTWGSLESLERQISPPDFVGGFMASLSLDGISRITRVSTFGGDHHRRFTRVAQTLDCRKAQGFEAARRMPDWRPRPEIGDYPELDRAITTLEHCGAATRIGYLPTWVELEIGDAMAERLLRDFTYPERELLTELSRLFSVSEA